MSDSMSGSGPKRSETCHENLPSIPTSPSPEPIPQRQCQECQVFSEEETQRIKEAVEHRDPAKLPDALRQMWEENVVIYEANGEQRQRAEELAWLDVGERARP